MRKTLSDKGVAALKPRPQRWAFPDPELRGHYVRVQPSGAKAFVTVARNPAGRQVWTSIGAADVMGIGDARKVARKAIERVRAGQPAIETKPESFAAVAANWIKRHVEPNGLRSAPEIKRLLERHVLPKWGDREFVSIRRSDVAALLDHVEDNHSARQADYVLNVVRSIMNWFAARNDDYMPAIARGMRRQNPKAQARTRVLTDPEIRAVWNRAEASGTFGAIVRFALLTAQRRSKLVTMRWSDLERRGFGRSRNRREKRTPPAAWPCRPQRSLSSRRSHAWVKTPTCSPAAAAVVSMASARASGGSTPKLTDVAPWTIHDLRRTARSLMSRAGVSSEHAERVLGHVIGGVEGVYNGTV